MRPPVVAAIAALLLFGVLFGVLFVGQDDDRRRAGGDATARGGETEREIAGGRPAPPPAPPRRVGPVVPGGDERGAPSDAGDDGSGAGESPGADEKVIPLPRGDAELRLRVVDRSRIPHPGVLVSVRAGRSLETLATDREGLAVFASLAAGNYTFRLASEEIPELTAVKELTVAAGEMKEVVIKIGRFDQQIRGRVLDRNGQPVAGMPVYARKQVFEVDEGDYVVADVSNLEAESGPDGSYELVHLEEADYLVRTEAIAEYPSVQKVFRAGIQNADLVLEATDDLEVYGTVRSSTGDVVEGVVVSVVGQALRQAVTDARGNFTLPVALSEDRSAYVVRARKDGYQDGQANLLRAEFEGFDRWQVQLVLEPLGLTVPVRGVLLDDLGNAVARESVMLYSSALNARHKAISDGDGQFDLGEVEVGSYRLWVYPRQRYEDYSLDPVEVPPGGLEIEIVLKSIATGTLRGTMVNPEGNPVSGFTLWLRSMSALGNSVTVTGDSLGQIGRAHV